MRSPAEDRLVTLLRQSTPEPRRHVDVDAILAAASNRRSIGRLNTFWVPAAALVALIAVVIILLGLVPGVRIADRSSVPAGPTESASPQPSATELGSVIPWTNASAKPTAEPTGSSATVLAADARQCRAADLRIGSVNHNGAGGHLSLVLRFVNTSPSACLLKGYPTVVASDPDLPAVTATDGSSFFQSGQPGNMTPGGSSQLTIETDTSCAARPGGGPAGHQYRHLAISFPGGGTLDTEPLSPGLDATCGLYLTTFTNPAAVVEVPPQNRLAKLRPVITGPSTGHPGQQLDYVVSLTNTGTTSIKLDPCPGYFESAFRPSSSELSMPVTKALYLLNCQAVPTVRAGQTVRFAMQLTLPTDLPPGPMTIDWMFLGPESVPATASLTVG